MNIKIIYYDIDERAAKHAHEMNSFRTYMDGQTTAEYRGLVDKAVEIADRQQSKVDPMYHDKIDGLLDAYSRKLADWFNKGSAIEARCPSMMISGGGNFPVRKKEKQNAARDRHVQAYNDITELLRKIEAVGLGGISSDDPEALDKLRAQLAILKENQGFMKSVNTYYRKHKTLVDYPGLDADQIKRIQKNMARDWRENPKPFRQFELSNNNANIKRIKGRIVELERLAEKGRAMEGNLEMTDNIRAKIINLATLKSLATNMLDARLKGLPLEELQRRSLDYLTAIDPVTVIGLIDRLAVLEAELAQTKAAAVQWATYDGTRDTLPPEFTTVALLTNEALRPAIVCHEEMDGGKMKPFWIIPFENGDFLAANVGDRWAYLPALPEASE